MSAEIQNKSPLGPGELQQHQTELFARLSTDQGAELQRLSPATSISVNPETVNSTSVTNEQLGITQSLSCIIKAGDSVFSVTKVSLDGTDDARFVVSTISGDSTHQRPVPFSVLSEGSTVQFGRGKFDSVTEDLFMSRNHFSINVEDSKVIITDTDSKDGTEVVTYPEQAPGSSEIDAQNLAAKGLFRRLRRNKGDSAQGKIVDDYTVWAPKSQKVVDLVKNTLTSDNSDEINERQNLDDLIDEIGQKLLLEDPLIEYNPVGDSYYQEIVQDIQLAVNEILQREPASVRKVLGIIFDSKFNDEDLPPALGRDGRHSEIDKTRRFLQIYNRDAKVAELLVKNNIGGFHGSKSGSIWGVIHHGGLLSAAEARSRGQILSSGERTYSTKEGQEEISFADWREPDSIRRYAGIDSGEARTVGDLISEADRLSSAIERGRSVHGDNHPFIYNGEQIVEDLRRQIDQFQQDPGSIEAELVLGNFPVAYGLDIGKFEIKETASDFKNNDEKIMAQNTIIRRVSSDVEGEFMVLGSEIPIGRVPVIAVPRGKIQGVQELFRKNGYSDIHIVDIEVVLGPAG